MLSDNEDPPVLRTLGVHLLFRYVFREVALASLVGTVLFTLVLFLQRVEPVMELVVGRGVPPADMLRLLVLTVPQAFPFTVPMGVLTGILVGLGRLTSDNEILAMVSSGVRARSLVRPVALVATLGLAACAATTLWLTPWSMREQVRIADSFRIRLAGSEVMPRVFIEDYPDHVIWVQDVLPGEGVHWKGIFMADMRPPAERASISGFNAAVEGPRITLASEAFLVPRPEQNRVQVRFPQTTTYERSRDPTQYLAFRSESADQVLQARPRRFDPRAKRYDSMDTSALIREVSGGGSPEAAILLHERFSLPFACWVLPLAGFPLAISFRRSGRSSGVVIAMLFCFAYWMISLAGTALAEQSLVPAGVTAWIANATFAIAGAWLLQRVDSPVRRDWQLPLGTWRSRAVKLVSRMRGEHAKGPRPMNGRAMRGPIDLLVPIVDRYVLRTFLFYLVVFLTAFVAIWYIFSFFELLNDMLTRDKAASFVPYAYYLTPFLLYNTAPLAVLVATLVCFGLLARQHELTAFRACGVSLYRLSVPILLVSAAIGGGLFALEESYLPEANRRQDALRDEIKGRPPRTYLRPDRQWTFGLRDRIFYHRAFDSRGNTFSGISVFDLRTEPFELRRQIHAESARWDPSGSQWFFEKGWVRTFDGIETDEFEAFESRAFPSIHEPPDYFLKRDRHDQQMNLGDLRSYIVDLTQSGFDTVRLRVQMHKKVAFPLFAFSMALLAIPFAMRTGDRSAMWPVCFGLGLTVAYYAINALFEQLGLAGQLQPPAAAWAPSLLFAIAGTYLMLRVRT